MECEPTSGKFMQSITVQPSGWSYTRFRSSMYCSSGDTGSLAIKILRCAPQVTGPLSPFQRKRQPDTEQPGVRCHASSSRGAHSGGGCSMRPEDNRRRSCPSTRMVHRVRPRVEASWSLKGPTAPPTTAQCKHHVWKQFWPRTLRP